MTKRVEIEIVSKQLNFPSLRSACLLPVRLWSLCSFGCQVTLDWVNWVNWVVNKYIEKAKSFNRSNELRLQTSW